MLVSRAYAFAKGRIGFCAWFGVSVLLGREGDGLSAFCCWDGHWPSCMAASSSKSSSDESDRLWVLDIIANLHSALGLLGEWLCDFQTIAHESGWNDDY